MFKINYIISLATILVLVAIFFIFNAEQSRYQLIGANGANSSGLFVFDSKDKNLNYCNEKNCSLLSMINPLFNNQMPTNSCGLNSFIPQSICNSFGQNNMQPNNQSLFNGQTVSPCYNGQVQQNQTGFYGQPQAIFSQSTNAIPDGMKQMIDINGQPLPINQTRTPQGSSDPNNIGQPQQVTQTTNQSLCNEYKRQADEYKKKYDEYKEKLKNVLTDKINSLENNKQNSNTDNASPDQKSQSNDDQNNASGGQDSSNVNDQSGSGGTEDSGSDANNNQDQNSDQGGGASGDSQDDATSGSDDSANQDGN
jgi:hypothetical protein